MPLIKIYLITDRIRHLCRVIFILPLGTLNKYYIRLTAASVSYTYTVSATLIHICSKIVVLILYCVEVIAIQLYVNLGISLPLGV